jgi:hypothetical protein
MSWPSLNASIMLKTVLAPAKPRCRRGVELCTFCFSWRGGEERKVDVLEFECQLTLGESKAVIVDSMSPNGCNLDAEPCANHCSSASRSEAWADSRALGW